MRYCAAYRPMLEKAGSLFTLAFLLAVAASAQNSVTSFGTVSVDSNSSETVTLSNLSSTPASFELTYGVEFTKTSVLGDSGRGGNRDYTNIVGRGHSRVQLQPELLRDGGAHLLIHMLLRAERCRPACSLAARVQLPVHPRRQARSHLP